MRRRGLLWRVVGTVAAAIVVVVVALIGCLVAVLGADLPCSSGGAVGGGSLGVAPTEKAKAEIPPERLPLYRGAGSRFNIDWTFLASIGTQECGVGTCAHIYWSGCGGPMQIALERESPCSPGPGPTIWERWKFDADGHGADPFDLADAIFTAARMLRPVFGLDGSSYAAYRETACNYYGACADSSVRYADEVMARAVEYGFRGEGIPAGGSEPEATPAAASSCGGGQALPTGKGPMGPTRKEFSPRRLASLPANVTAGSAIECDARIIPDVAYIARRFGLIITACYGATGHEADGEHPRGAAIDSVPRDGNWDRTRAAAEAAGWHSSCAASGVAPACARPPFRFVGYDGYPGHGDPEHCQCGDNAHLHLSWLNSGSPGEPENAFLYAYAPAKWIEVFEAPGSTGAGGTGGTAGRWRS
jgi:hypothetical protein